MERNTIKNKYNLFVVLFILLNALATYIVTTETLNRYIITFDYTLKGMINSFIGNVSFLLFVVLIVNLLAKKLKGRIGSLVISTFVLNGILFWINIFNRFYGTSFTIRAFQIFQNPAGNFGLTIFFEALREIIIYYRIIIFIPFIILLVIATLLKRKVDYNYVFKLEIKPVITHFLGFIILVFTNIVLFCSGIGNQQMVSSAKATYATQNLGLYNFLWLDAIGFDYNMVEFTPEEVFDELQKYNKNKPQYRNLIDNRVYNYNVKLSEVSKLSGKLVDEHDSIYTKGLLEDYNLVLVHLETFNYFLLEFEETSKKLYNLRAILDESYVFKNFYTTVGLGNSFDAEFSVLTGLYSNGTSTLAWDYNQMPADNKYNFQSLPKLFKQKNYQTNSFHGNSGEFYNREKVHPEMFKFDKLYSSEVMLELSGLTTKEVAEMYNHEAGVWLSDRFTLNYLNEFMNNTPEDTRFMNFLITMLPHTPFYYDPYYPDPYNTDMYDEELVNKLDILTLKYFNYLKYYNEIIRMFIEDINGYGDDYVYNEENLYKHKKTAYVFYGDHGSSIQFSDVNLIANDDLNNLEIRQKLLQTISFIYVPGNNLVTKVIDGNEVTLYEGLLKGEQTLVRDQIDLYRTIIDLFNLPITNKDLLYGVNGLSNEPSYALDNKSLNVITDSFVGNIRNGGIHFINNQLELSDVLKLKNEIANFKRYSDIALINNLYYKMNYTS